MAEFPCRIVDAEQDTTHRPPPNCVTSFYAAARVYSPTIQLGDSCDKCDASADRHQ